MKHQALLFALLAALAASCHPPQQTASGEEWPLVLTMRGDTTTLSPRSPAGSMYVILYNGYSCKDCFPKLASALRLYDSSRGRASETVAVTRARNGAYGRRQALNEVRKILPGIESVYFDCADTDNDPWPPEDLKGGIFGICGISKTPSLLVLDEHGKTPLRCITYEQLFGNADEFQSNDTEIQGLVATLDTLLRP